MFDPGLPVEAIRRKLQHVDAHERTHFQVTEHNARDDFSHLMNEALTDMTTLIAICEQENLDYFDPPKDVTSTIGYATLVRWMQAMMREGWITRDEVVEYALLQDEQKLVDLLQKIARQSPEDFLLIAEQKRVMLPVLPERRAGVIDELKTDPVTAIRREVETATTMLGSWYFGDPLYMVGLHEHFVTEDPDYVNRMIAAYAKQGKQINSESFNILLDPVSKTTDR